MRPEETLVPITMFLSTAAILIVWLFTRHKERTTMIEKGLSSEEIKAMYHRDRRQFTGNPLSSLKWGILFVLAGVAILLGNYLHAQFNVEENAMIGLILLFVGIGLVLFYNIASKKMGQTP